MSRAIATDLKPRDEWRSTVAHSNALTLVCSPHRSAPSPPLLIALPSVFISPLSPLIPRMATLNSNPIVYHARDTSTAALAKRKHIMHLQQEEQMEDEEQTEPWTAEEVFGQCATAPLRFQPRRRASLRMQDLSPRPSVACPAAELIRHINDPEHPLTLEQLNVAQLALVRVNDLGPVPAVPGGSSSIDIQFTPTIPHCRSDSHARWERSTLQREPTHDSKL